MLTRDISVNGAMVACSVIMILGMGCGTTSETPISPSRPRSTDLFVSGEDGYHTYRIPALIVTKQGSLLAFCEGRKNNRRDHGDIDLLVKRSTDGGQTWSGQQVVYEEGGSEEITIGNPCPVVDQKTGTIWLPFCRDNKNVLMTHSIDDGISWAPPIDITTDVKKPEWALSPKESKGIPQTLWYRQEHPRLTKSDSVHIRRATANSMNARC